MLRNGTLIDEIGNVDLHTNVGPLRWDLVNLFQIPSPQLYLGNHLLEHDEGFSTREKTCGVLKVKSGWRIRGPPSRSKDSRLHAVQPSSVTRRGCGRWSMGRVG